MIISCPSLTRNPGSIKRGRKTKLLDFMTYTVPSMARTLPGTSQVLREYLLSAGVSPDPLTLFSRASAVPKSQHYEKNKALPSHKDTFEILD